MSWRTTAVLFIILVLLGGYVYYQNQRGPEPLPTPTPGEPAPERVRLIEATIDDVTRLDITRHEDGTHVSYSRDQVGEWMRTVPTTTVVLSTTMNLQVSALINTSSSRNLPPDLNPLSAYGLETPAYDIVVAIRGENEQINRHTLYVGDKTPTGTEYYVQREGDDRVHLVPFGPIEGMINLVDLPPLAEPD